MDGSDLLDFKDLLYEKDDSDAVTLRTLVYDVSDLATDEARALVHTVVADSARSTDADSPAEIELRRSLLLAVCVARGLQDPDVARGNRRRRR